MEFIARGDRASGSSPQFALHEQSSDDGYWESLLEDGEVVSFDGPPPWLTSLPEEFVDDVNETATEATEEELDWQRASMLLEDEAHCCAPVTGCNRGGLLVSFGCLVGFVPSSHLLSFPVHLDFAERELALSQRIGDELKLHVIEIDRPRGRLVLSERAAYAKERSANLFARLKVGDIVPGRVSNLRRFGAFVDLGGYEGLLHISELSWGRVNEPSDVVKVGDEVQVYVMEINPEERKIQLSLKYLESDPWEGVYDRYTVGELVWGEVTNVVNFGAFTRLENGVEGLIHISELAEGTFLHPRNVVQEGERVHVRILGIDPDNRRIALSLRQARVHFNGPATSEWS